MTRTLRLLFVTLGLITLLNHLPLPQVAAQSGATIVVYGGCTLADAIHAANTDQPYGRCPAGNGADTIMLTSKIYLDEIADTTDGPNALPSITSDITISGNTLEIVVKNQLMRIFHVSSTGILRLRQISLFYGHVSFLTPPDPVYNQGGSIFVRYGQLDIDNASISNSFASEKGGAIYNHGGLLTIQRLRISATGTTNNAITDGAGIYNDSLHPAFIDNSDLQRTIQGGVYNTSGSSLTIERSTLHYVANSGILEMENSSYFRFDNLASGQATLNFTSGYRTPALGYTDPVVINDGLLTIDNSVIYNPNRTECTGTGQYLGSNNIASTHSCPGVIELIPTSGLVYVSDYARDRGGDCGLTDIRSLPRDEQCDIGVYEETGGTIFGWVWEDLLGNGWRRSYHYPGVDDVLLTLRDSTGTPIATQTSANDGRYVFTGLAPGIYTIAITLPPNYVLTPQNSAGAGNSNDSDADPLTGITDPINLRYEGSVTQYDGDFGIYEPVTLTGLLYLDENDNGVHDPGEMIYRNTEVRARRENPPTNRFSYTNNSGIYTFKNLPPGMYNVAVVTEDMLTAAPDMAQDRAQASASVELLVTSNTTRGRRFDIGISGGFRAAPTRNLYLTSTPTLTWGSVEWAAGYAIQVDNNRNFNSPEFQNQNMAVNMLEITTSDLADGLYYWRVRARRADGSWGPWSPPDHFVIDAP